MNGFLKTTYHGTRQVLQQLVFTAMLKQQLHFREASNEHESRHLLGEHTYALGKIRTHELSSDDKQALRELPETRDLAEHSRLQVAGRILRDSTIFYSRLHKTDGAKNNRICQFMFDGDKGLAEIDFFIIASEPFVMLRAYQLSSNSFMDTIRSSRLHSENTALLSNYVSYIERNAMTQKVVPLSALVKKAVYIKVRGGNSDIVSVLPNLYEHH